MDIRKVKKLIELLEESGLAELEIHEGEESVRMSRHSSTLAAVPAAAVPVAAPAPLAPPSRSRPLGLGWPALLRPRPLGPSPFSYNTQTAALLVWENNI